MTLLVLYGRDPLGDTANGFDIRTLDLKAVSDDIAGADATERESSSRYYSLHDDRESPLHRERSFVGEDLVADPDGLIGGMVRRIEVRDYTYNWPSDPEDVLGYTMTFLNRDAQWGYALDPADLYRYSPGQLMKKILAARDEITGSDYDDMLWGYGDSDTLIGRAGADRLDGGSGRDRLLGGEGNDRLIGGEDGDWLRGDQGRDLLYGGAGPDTFMFNRASDSVVGAQRDVIQDFETGLDLIDLSKIDANGVRADGDQAFTWIGDAAFTGAGQIRLAHGVLEGNINGDLGADFEIRIRGNVGEGDFIL